MDNISCYAVIRYLSLKGLTPKVIHEVTLGEDVLHTAGTPYVNGVSTFDGGHTRGGCPSHSRNFICERCEHV